MEQKSLPKSAAEKVDQILKQAVLDQNSPQVIKALIHQGKYDLVLDWENDTTVFNNLLKMVERSENAAERSVLHSMLGELYLQYYQKDGWTIDQRTELGDLVPDDMKEWTRGILFNKVVDHLNASLAEQKELEQVKVEAYADVILLGKDSRTYYPTLYDFLARRAIEVFRQMGADQEVSSRSMLETYDKLQASLKERGMEHSILLLELDKEVTKSSLDQLLEQWKGKDISVEIIDKIAEQYQNEIRQFTEEDSLLRELKTKELFELLQDGIQQYPSYERIGLLENKLQLLTRPEFRVNGNKTFHAGGKIQLEVAFKNLRSLNAKLYRIDSPLEVEIARSGVHNSIERKRRHVKDVSVSLPERVPYLEGTTSLVIDAMEPGTYMLEFVSTPKVSTPQAADYYFAVSNLAVFSRSSGKDAYDFFVVDRHTGEPVSNASVKLYKLPGNWRNSVLTEVATLPVNQQGMAVYQKDIPNNDVYYHAVAGDDNGSLLNRLPYAYWGYGGEENTVRESVAIFTDRGLYRPGQVVYYKGIVTRVEERESNAVVGKSIEFTLRDANGRELTKQQHKSNEFGSVSGEFVLPTGILTGGFTIETEGGSTYFQVEEYKRPTFEIAFEPIRHTYKFEEEIVLKGKAESYSGVKLQGATVDYRITRQQMRWWGWLGNADHFAEGVVQTDSEGAFEIHFTPEKPNSYGRWPSIYSFVVEASVTDINGETSTSTYTVTVGDVSMILALEMPDQWEKNSTEKVRITAKNLDGSDVAAKGTYRIFSLHENDSIHQQVGEGDFIAGEQHELQKRLVSLPSGKYRVKLTSRDDRGNLVEAEKDAILFSYTDQRPPVKTNAWFLEKNTGFSADRPAEVILGATDHLYVLYELWQENELLERKWMEVNNENRLFSLPYKEEYAKGVTLMLTYVKDEQFYAHRSNFQPIKEDKKLQVTLDVFRDRIRPGAEEEWRIRVTDPSGRPAPAEVLASMYDFSLDQIYPSQPWNLFIYSPDRYHSRMSLASDYSFMQESARGYIGLELKTVPSFLFDQFNWFDYSLFYYGGMLLRGTSSNILQESVVMAYGQPKMRSVTGAVEEDQALPPPTEPPAREDGAETGSVRRNFNETAFFYPNLRTNEKGETVVAFTVPESNTRWRFRVLAHDKALNHGQAEAFSVSQKELMVTPNMPRFLRHGDRASITAKISNLSDSTITGNATLEFFDPLTDKAIEQVSLVASSHPFSVASDASTDVSWSFDVPEDRDLIGLRIVARGERFSDGEQHALAILPNRMLVTESMRMDVKANETKTFTMERLVNPSSSSMEDYRLTLEFTSNPAWYAVQALPVLGEPLNDNAVAWFASYYANSLGAHIVHAYPKVTAMIEAWKRQGGNEETLLSNLEKNEELKSVLLEETPWVLEARNESEQKQKLALLFDLNRSSHLTRTAIDKLTELQSGQGGWSWFKGFRPNVAITHYILFGFQQLKELDALDVTDEIEAMQQEALGFIDAEAIRRFDALKRYNKEWRKIKSISLTDLEYLFVRTAYTTPPLDKEVREIRDFYLSVIEKNWTSYGLYERSLIALLMERERKAQTMQAILASFREHATQDEEMGMYWPNNRAHVFMSQSALSVHTFIMAAFRAGDADAKEMDEMKRWLLKQKQTQLWESTHATMDAVYTLLSTGSDWLASSGETGIHVGSHSVEPKSQELGTGYIKESWSGTEIKPEMGNVHVSHNGPTAAWGALYWQYYEDMDKITKTDGSLDIEKQLFVEEMRPTGAHLVQVTQERSLKVGDKVVVRLVLRTDRDMEFVHLKDTRAASFEPVDQVSGIVWQEGIPYYRTSGDASTNFYMDTLPRGTYVFEYSVRVNRTGSYSNGITTVQCMYAPEFTSHTAGMRVEVTE